MTLFGVTIGGMQIFGLVSLLMVLILWLMAWKAEHGYSRWFRQWEADRKARRDAELAAQRGETPPSSTGAKRGPWG